MRSFYEILGVRRDATNEEIVAAYRKRVLETHPDKGGNPIEFQNVRKGFEILSDERKRLEYDRWLALKESAEAASSNPQSEVDPVIEEIRTKLMPYIEVLLECHCDSRKLREHVLYVCSKVDDVFLNIDVISDKSVQAAIVISRCVSIIREAHIFQWEDVLDSLVDNCNSIIHKTTSASKCDESKKSRTEHATRKPFVVFACITLIVASLSMVAMWEVISKEDGQIVPPSSVMPNADDKESDNSAKTKRQILYEALTRDGYDLGDYNSFSSKIDDHTIRRNFYDVISRHYDLGSYEDFSRKLDEECAMVEDFKKWVYSQLKGSNRITISYAAFEKNLKNESDRKWYYTKAVDIGLQVGTYEEFCRKIGYTSDINSAKINEVSTDNSPSSGFLEENTQHSFDTPSYSETNFNTGNAPYKEYFGVGQFDNESLSELTVLNYSSDDAVVLLCTLGDRVIRNVFIEQGSTYTLRQIPEGRYIVKIMYGKSWNKEKDNGLSFPKGGFMKNVSFSKTEEDDLFDYTFERSYDGINYPTYSITLHKVQNGNLQMDNISQSDFFN